MPVSRLPGAGVPARLGVLAVLGVEPAGPRRLLLLLLLLLGGYRRRGCSRFLRLDVVDVDGECRLGQHDGVREGGELVHRQLLVVNQVRSGDRWHSGEELEPGAVTLAVGDGLQVTDGGQELRGALVSEGGEAVELLGPLVVG